ncbi:MAG: hypothetical protein U5L02_12345 [Rheinheimera sp.]|nr:hypothetical protein [Rheinheimera sp.]
MRNLYSGFLLGLLLICSSLFYGLALTNSDKKFQQQSSVLDGTWRLVSVRQFDAAGKALPVSASAQALQSLKIVANRHFSRVTTADDGKVISATAGLIELSADLYREYTGFKPDAHSGLAYQWQLEEGLLTQRRTDKDQVIEEVWQLVD